jgi:NAD(P)-dependent dehydrogenase (short-subunit alcohol dehydrogenase family)
VVLADINAPGAKRVAETLSSGDGQALPLEMDVSRVDSVSVAAETIREQFGGLDILVNNAAIVDIVGFDALQLEHYWKILRVNLDGALIVSMAMVPLIRSRTSHGRILNIASIMGVRSAPGATAYSTAKGGVVNLTRSMACDLAKDGIVVNAVAPGFIDTPMCLLPDGSGHEHQQQWFQDIYIKYKRIPLGRAGTPDDVAGPAVFFCSDDARYVTGQILLVDGGVSATF